MEAAQRQDRGPAGDAAADDQISEDEKIERFYQLIRNYKEARDRQRIERERSSAELDFECSGKRKKKMKVGDREQSTWIPAFKWEDFTEKAKVEFGCPPVIFPASDFNDSRKRSNVHADAKDPPPIPAEVDGGGGLDLKLRL